MFLTSDLCRAQELAQRDRANNHPLPHVRLLAAKAEIAWHKEVVWAEKREQRQSAPVPVVIDPLEDFSGPDPDEYVPRAMGNDKLGSQREEEAAPL